jgi:hypothetical protein
MGEQFDAAGAGRQRAPETPVGAVALFLNVTVRPPHSRALPPLAPHEVQLWRLK